MRALQMEPETIYTSSHQPSPASALDVLAFVLTPAAAFATSGDPRERAEVEALFESAKAEAVARWLAARAPAQRG